MPQTPTPPPQAQHGLSGPILIIGLLVFAVLALQPIGAGFQIGIFCTILAGLLVLSSLLSRESDHFSSRANIFRLTGVILALYIQFRYFDWRLGNTLVWDHPVGIVASLALVSAELYGFLVMLIGAWVVSWPLRREPAPLQSDPPTVDILIPTYNEDGIILEATLLAATQLDYPISKYTVYLCDDGGTDQRRADPKTRATAEARRLVLQNLCERHGAVYVTRPENTNAKAGNLNHALTHHCKSELVLILDADHVPTRDILKNTVGFFGQDPKLFLVQTPHYFVNPDPLERNLQTHRDMPGEPEMFYGFVQNGLDSWGASYFCGSAAVLRRSSLAAVGGLAGETVTEDAETALGLHAGGGTSVYFGRAMVAGLQPENFDDFIQQRSRWAQGMVQLFLLKNPWTTRGLSTAQKLCYTSSVLYWLFPFARVIFFVAPLAYLFFGIPVVSNIQQHDVLFYILPQVLTSVLLTNLIYGKTRWPLVSELYETIQFFYTLPAVIATVRNPRHPQFKVTPKNSNRKDDYISSLALPFYIAALVSSVGLGVGIWRFVTDPAERGQLLLVILITGLNTIFLLAAVGVMLEKVEAWNKNRLSAKGLRAKLWVRTAYLQTAVEPIDLSVTTIGLMSPIPFTIAERLQLVLEFDHDPGTLHLLSADVSANVYQADRSHLVELTFAPQSDEERRVAVDLVYGDSELHEQNRRLRQHPVNIVYGIGFIASKAFRHFFGNLQFLSGSLVAHMRRRLSPARRPLTQPTSADRTPAP